MKRPFLVLIILLVFVLPAWAQPDNDDGIRIFSDSLRIMDQTGVIQFEGNVRIQMKDATLTCDRLTVRTSEQDPSQVVSGTAVGGVSMERGEERVQAGEAHFDLDEAMVELTDSPSLIRGKATIQAERILYSLEEGTAQFHGPVKAVFQTEGK